MTTKLVQISLDDFDKILDQMIEQEMGDLPVHDGSLMDTENAQISLWQLQTAVIPKLRRKLETKLKECPTLEMLEEAQRLLNESPDWADQEDPGWMELPTPVGALVVNLIPKTREIISVKWQEEKTDG